MASLQERQSLAALSVCSGIGNTAIFRIKDTLTKHEQEWSEFWVMTGQKLAKIGLSQKQIDGISRFKTEHTVSSYYQSLQFREIRVVCIDDIEYPPLLQKLDCPPCVLFVKGRKIEWESAGWPVAVIGARNMTSYGEFVTKKISRELSLLGSPIISGFMYGVDTCAHLAALDAGGLTIGVLGYGFDHCYPSSHKDLMAECFERGMTFFSPFVPEVSPHRGNFPARNRVVAGMASAVVITEAAEKSGSHITAQFALDEGRAVCAVPGPITNPYSSGTKWLLNQGATLVSSGIEVLEEIQPKNATPQTELQEKILLRLSRSSASIEELLQTMQVPVSVLSTEVALLEVLGHLKQTAGKWRLATNG